MGGCGRRGGMVLADEPDWGIVSSGYEIIRVCALRRLFTVTVLCVAKRLRVWRCRKGD